MNFDEAIDFILKGKSINFEEIEFDINDYHISRNFDRFHESSLFENEFFNVQKKTLLHFSIESKNIEMVRKLINSNANIGLPLITEVTRKTRDLEDYGWSEWSDESVYSSSSTSTLDFAIKIGIPEIIHILQKNGLKGNMRPKNKGYRTRNPFKAVSESHVDLSEGDSESEDPSIVWRGLKHEDVALVLSGKGVQTRCETVLNDDNIIAISKDHIENGSQPEHSCPAISASRSKKVSARYASDKLPNGPDPSTYMIKIKLDVQCKSIDLTEPDIISRLNLSNKVTKFAENSQEVLIFNQIPQKNIIGLFSVKSWNAPWQAGKYNELKAKETPGLLRFRAYEKPVHRCYQVTEISLPTQKTKVSEKEEDIPLGALSLDGKKEKKASHK